MIIDKIKDIFKKKEKYIVIGNKYNMQNLIDSFENLTNYIEFFIDENASDNEYFLNRPIFNMDVLKNTKYSNYKFVIFNIEKRNKITNSLIKKNEVKKENIFTASQWLLNMLKNKKDIIHKPKALRIDICSICQLNCVACYMRLEDSGTTGKGYMKFEQYKEILDKYPYVKEIEISNNGEPFLNPDIVKILKYSHEKGVRIRVDNGTNFNNIKDDVLEAIVKYRVKSISMSIDGATNQTYKKYRVNGNFDNIMQSIDKINKYKKKYNINDPFMIWKYILMDHNEDEVEKAIEMSKEKNTHISFFQDWRGYKPTDPEKMKQLTGIDFLYKGKNKLFSNFCMHMILTPQINWDGRLFGCCMTYKTDWNKNIFTDGLIESLNSDYYRHAIYKLLGDNTNYNEENQCTNHCDTYTNFISKGDCIDL